MTLEPSCKMSGNRMEKYTLRKAFDDPDDPYLPKEVLWRQKEQFSDGVGYGWIDAVKDFTAEHVSDADMARAAGRFPFNTPDSKEAYWLRSVFEQHFPLASAAQTVPGGVTTRGGWPSPGKP